MEQTLKEKLEQALFIAHSLYMRGKVSGSTGNLSFLHEDRLMITASGSCFGTLRETDFSALSLTSLDCLSSLRPSKEWPMHRLLYETSPNIRAVIHTHSPFTALWSCRSNLNPENPVPRYTPYLQMKVGTVALVPYAPPGSQALFDAFQKASSTAQAHLLQNHGGIVGGASLMDALYGIEELEESCRIACLTADSPKNWVLLEKDP